MKLLLAVIAAVCALIAVTIEQPEQVSLQRVGTADANSLRSIFDSRRCYEAKTISEFFRVPTILETSAKSVPGGAADAGASVTSAE